MSSERSEGLGPRSENGEAALDHAMSDFEWNDRFSQHNALSTQSTPGSVLGCLLAQASDGPLIVHQVFNVFFSRRVLVPAVYSIQGSERT